MEQFPLHQPFDQAINQADLSETGYNRAGIIEDTYNESPFNQPIFDQFGPELRLNNSVLNQAFGAVVPAVGQTSVPQTTMNIPQPPIINEDSFAEAAQSSPPANGYAHAGKTISQMMEENTPDTYQGYITSHEQVERLEAEYPTLSWPLLKSPRQSHRSRWATSLAPTSLEARAHWRERIFYAITDFGKVVNKDRKKCGQGEKKREDFVAEKEETSGAIRGRRSHNAGAVWGRVT